MTRRDRDREMIRRVLTHRDRDREGKIGQPDCNFPPSAGSRVRRDGYAALKPSTEYILLTALTNHDRDHASAVMIVAILR